MSKRDDKHSLAKDYLARIKWDGEHPYMGDGSKPDIPNWKYKPIHHRSPMSASSRVITATVTVFVLVALLYLAFIKQEGGAICISVLLIFLGSFLFLATRDASKSDDHEGKD